MGSFGEFGCPVRPGVGVSTGGMVGSQDRGDRRGRPEWTGRPRSAGLVSGRRGYDSGRPR
jgi:hypothetical protein